MTVGVPDMPGDPLARLRMLAGVPGPVIDIAEAALACAALDRSGLDLAPYRAHLDALARGARALDGAAPPDLLAGLLAGEHGYRGDSETYDDLANADLARVIDRRRGLPVALSILWMHAARARGWRCVGLNMPAHFLLRLEAEDGAWTIDAFDGGRALDGAELSARRRAAGLRAAGIGELDDRAVLLRLQNNIRIRLQQGGEPGRALGVMRRMLAVAPSVPALWEDAAALHEAEGSLRGALECLDAAMALAGSAPARQRIATMRARLASRLN
jgi:regulator of sirC expression with transglutaminase-like and TPR domain